MNLLATTCRNAAQIAVSAQRRVVFFDVNADGSGDDCDPDVTASGETADLDQRYSVSYDDTGVVRALTGYTSGGGGNNGKVIERYVRIPGVGTLTQAGDGGSGETGAPAWGSGVGNPIAPFEYPDGGPDYLTWCEWGCWAGQCFFTVDCHSEAGGLGGLGSPPPTCGAGSVAVGGECVGGGGAGPAGPPVGPCLPGMVQWGADGCVPEWVNPLSLAPPLSSVEDWGCAAEWDWALSHLDCAQISFLVRHMTFGIVQRGTSGPTHLHDWRNAILHCTWQCLLAQSAFCDCEDTKSLGDAHELCTDGSLMDYHNNWYGRNAAGCGGSGANQGKAGGIGSNLDVEGAACFGACARLACAGSLTWTDHTADRELDAFCGRIILAPLGIP